MQTEAIAKMLFMDDKVTSHGLQNSTRFKLDVNMAFSLTIRYVFNQNILWESIAEIQTVVETMGTDDPNLYFSIVSNLHSYCINQAFYHMLYPPYACNFTTFI